MKLAPVKTLAAVALVMSVSTQADWSTNVGSVSDYHFRGIFQSDSSTSAGLDYENGGWYAGTWAADVDDELEIDGYVGYGREVGGFDVGVSLIFASDDLVGDADESLVFTLGKSFSF